MRQLLAAVVGGALLTSVTPAHADLRPKPAGDVYVEFAGSLQRASRAYLSSGAVDSPTLTNSDLRIWGQAVVAPRWRVYGRLVPLRLRAVEDNRSFQFGDIDLGTSVTIAHGTRGALATALFVRIPTGASEPLGPAYPLDGRSAQAATRAGLWNVHPRLLASLQAGPTWWNFHAGYNVRPHASDQATGGLDVWFPLWDDGTLSGTTGAHFAFNTTRDGDQPPWLLNGEGAAAEAIGWFLRMDYRLPSGWGVGGGVDGGYLVRYYPAALDFLLRVSWTGRAFGDPTAAR